MEPPDLSGHVLAGKYRIDHPIGKGGMGAVYAATQLSIGRRVALKVLLPALSVDHTALARFRREAEIAASLGHPNIVQVTDFDTDFCGPFYVMELLEGESLADLLRRERKLEPRRVVSIAVQVLSALSAVHRRGVVHRDLKPPNVFLARVAGLGEMAKVLDFGVAKLLLDADETRLTRTGFAVGTITHMSPEQLTGGEIDVRTDLYALGVIMYRALAGQLPFQGSRELLPSLILSTPVPGLATVVSGVDPRLAAIVERALSKDPDARFPDADAMAEAIVGLDRTEPGPAPRSIEIAATVPAKRVATTRAGTAVPTRAERPNAQPAARRRSRAPLVVGGGIVAALLSAVAVAVIATLLAGRDPEPVAQLTAAPDASAPLLVEAHAPPDKPPLAEEIALDAGAEVETVERGPGGRGGGVTTKRRRVDAGGATGTGSDSTGGQTEVAAATGGARRIDIGGTEYIEVGDVIYRLVNSDLRADPLYSVIVDSRVFVRHREHVTACLIATRYVPPMPAARSCWSIEVDANGRATRASPIETPDGDDRLDHCARGPTTQANFGPTRTGEGGELTLCLQAYRRRR